MCTGTHPFIPADGVVKLELIYEVLGQRCENVVHLSVPAGVSPPGLTDIANKAILAWEAHLAPVTSTSVALDLVRVTDLTEDDGYGVEIAPASTLTGDLTSPIMPLNVTCATKFASGFTGRSRRGRVYFVGLTEVQCVGNQLDASAEPSITSGWSNFFAYLETNVTDARHVVVSYCADGDWRTDALVTVVTNYSTDIALDSMRRRLQGRGR